MSSVRWNGLEQGEKVCYAGTHTGKACGSVQAVAGKARGKRER